jgi:hypothetical protein
VRGRHKHCTTARLDERRRRRGDGMPLLGLKERRLVLEKPLRVLKEHHFVLKKHLRVL